MEIKRVVFVLADISGYTRFMKMHTPNQKLSPLDLVGYFVGGIGGNIAETIRYRLTRK
jgi:hypothetical protein